MQPVKVKERPLPYAAIESQIKFLQGKVLTVIEAAMTDNEQRKAVKSLINNEFSGQLSWIYELCGYPSSLTASNTEVRPRGKRTK